MKKFGIIVSLLSLVWGCSVDMTEPEAPQDPSTPSSGATLLNIDASENKRLDIEAENIAVVLEVVSESPWTLTFVDTRSSLWLSADKTEGVGNDKVTFNIEENRTKSSRTIKVMISNVTGKAEMSITQKNYSPSNLSITPTSLETDYTAKSIYIELTSNLKWEIESSDESICVPSPIRGAAGEANIKLAITENFTNQDRVVNINVFSGYDEETVRIVQTRKKPEINIDKGIKTLDDLCRFRDAVNKGDDLSEWKYNGEINLLNDIDLSYVENWVPIGFCEENAFKEIFNGNGFTISNATIHHNSTATGFFGWNMGTIKNLTLTEAEIINEYDGNSCTGGIAGRTRKQATNHGGIIKNCMVSAFIKGNEKYKAYGISFNDGEGHNISDCSSKSIVFGEGISNEYDKETCLDEGLTNESFPYVFFQLLQDKGVLTKDRYTSKDDVYEAIDSYGGSIYLDLSDFKMTNPQVIERFASIREINIYNNYFDSLDLSDKGVSSFINYIVDWKNKYYGGYVRHLNLSGCALWRFDYVEPSSYEDCLKSLDISYATNVLRKLDLRQYRQLKELELTEARIKELTVGKGYDVDLSGNEYLEKLEAFSPTVKYENCPNLHYLQSGYPPKHLNCRQYPKLDTLIIWFTALEAADCLESLDITANHDLTYLNVCYNKLKELDVSNNLKIKYLNCSNNRMHELDVSQCKYLETLYCGAQQDDNNEEQTLVLSIPSYFYDTWQILRQYGENKNVVFEGELNIPDEAFRRYLEGIGVTSIEDAETLTKLDLGEIRDIKSLKGIECFTGLDTLITPHSLHTTLDLSKNAKLRYLVTSAKVDLTVLPELEHLNLDVGFDSNAAPIDLSRNIKLKWLNVCVGHGITTSLDLSRQIELEYLYIWGDGAKIPTIDLSKNINLKQLFIHVEVYDIDLKYLCELTELVLIVSSLQSLDLSNNIKLESIIGYNIHNYNSHPIQMLDVSNNILLETLRWQHHELKSLDITNLKALKELDCSGNKLTYLDISSNTALESLNCSDNRLGLLDISKCPITLDVESCYRFIQRIFDNGDYEITPLDLYVSEEQYASIKNDLDKLVDYRINIIQAGSVPPPAILSPDAIRSDVTGPRN